MDNLGPKKIKLELEIYLGKPVRVRTAKENSMGIVEEVSPEYLSLKPSWINEGIYTNNKLIDEFICQDELPQKIKIAAITGIDPLREGYIERLVKSINDLSTSDENSK
jgi:hypothetical protein